MGAADFSGWATKAGLKCSDGRTILKDAFKHQDKMQVPLVWQHVHDEPTNVLGHAILENREDGVYTYGYFNDTDAGKNAKQLVQHGDITALSIFANKLVEKSKNVMHGNIVEVSLVLAGANKGALIDNIAVRHSDNTVDVLDEEAIIHTGLALEHADKDESDSDETVQQVYDTLSDKQKDVVNYMIGQALESSAAHSDSEGDDKDPEDEDKQDDDKSEDTEGDQPKDENLEHQDKDGTEMSKNVFEQTKDKTSQGPTLTHSQLEAIRKDAERMGSFKDAFLMHAEKYGIENIDLLFPDAKAIDTAPELVGRRTEWVNVVINGARKTPFSRIKSLAADITHDEARAKGYVKGNLKKEEWFALTKRETTPTTIYKKQKLDRDDIIDITDLDVVAWLKGEMRLMLDEEIGRAVLVGDGREVDDEDKINENKIRPIATDDDFYAHKVVIPAHTTGDAIVEAFLRNRMYYRGRGNPTMFTTESLLTDLLLVKDKMGRRLYNTQAELESALRVSRIVTVDVMESRSVNGGELIAILVNMADYVIGADRGGNVSMFDDFDIDYNQYKYLIEGRMSGALTKFKTALVFTRGSGTLIDPTEPTFVPSTGVVTIPNQSGVIFRNKDTGNVLSAGAQTALAPGASIEVEWIPATGFYFANNTDNDVVFTRPVA